MAQERFHSSNSDVEAVKADALAFMAQRLAGLEFHLEELTGVIRRIEAHLLVISKKMK